MADVTLNSAVRSNLRTLQSTTDLLNRTEQRLSTGKKVNSAFDNPGSFFTAQALDRRSGDLASLLDNVSNSVKTLEAADNGIRAITDVVEGLKASARSALQSPSAVTTKASVESASVSGMTENNLLGSGAATAVSLTGSQTGLTTSTTLASLGFGSTSGETFQLEIPGVINYSRGTLNNPTLGDLITSISPYINASLTGDGRLELTATDPSHTVILGGSAAGFAGLGIARGTHAPSTGSTLVAGKTMSFSDSSGAAKTVTLSASAGANNVATLDALNAWLRSNDVALEASVSDSGGSGKLKFETTNASANQTPANIGGTIASAGGAFASDQSFSAPVLDPAIAARRIGFVKDYNDALKQISSLARDSSFNGVNLLGGDDLEITFNEDGTSSLGVKGAQFDADGLGLGALLDEAFHDGKSINEVLDKIESAFAQLEAQSSKFGSQLQIVQTRETFTKDMIGTLDDGALALVGADTNEEAANLATLQTRQSLIVSSLAISTQQESNVLQLLR